MVLYQHHNRHNRGDILHKHATVYNKIYHKWQYFILMMAIKMANNNIKTSIYTYCNTLLQHERNTCESATKSVEPNKLAGMKVFSLRLLKELFSRSRGLYMLFFVFCFCRECFSYDTLEQRMEGEPI